MHLRSSSGRHDRFTRHNGLILEAIAIALGKDNPNVLVTGNRQAHSALLHMVDDAGRRSKLENVAGSWSGSGTMKPADGPRERVRCKADYSVKNSGLSVKMNVRCASDAYKMELSANINQQGTNLSGDWLESQYRQGGKVSGRNINSLIEAGVESDTITALLTVQTNGARQTFSMESPGAWV